MNEQMMKAIESVLAKGDRVELIPIKDGVKVMRVRRENVRLSDYKLNYFPVSKR